MDVTQPQPSREKGNLLQEAIEKADNGKQQKRAENILIYLFPRKRYSGKNILKK